MPATALVVQDSPLAASIACPSFELVTRFTTGAAEVRDALGQLPRGECFVSAAVPTSWVHVGRGLIQAGFQPVGCQLHLHVSLHTAELPGVDSSCRLVHRDEIAQLVPEWQTQRRAHLLLADGRVPLSTDVGAQEWLRQAFAGSLRIYVAAGGDAERHPGWLAVAEHHELLTCQPATDSGVATNHAWPLLGPVLARARQRGFARADVTLSVAQCHTINAFVSIGFRVQAAQMIYRWLSPHLAPGSRHDEV